MHLAIFLIVGHTSIRDNNNNMHILPRHEVATLCLLSIDQSYCQRRIQNFNLEWTWIFLTF